MKYLFYLCLFALLLPSCSNDNSPSDVVKSSSPCLDEMLEFSDMDEFQNFMSPLFDMSLSDVKGTSILKDFNSMLKIDEAAEFKTEEELKDYNSQKVLDDDYLAAVLNGEGEVKIGDAIYQLGNTYVYVYLDCVGKGLIERFNEDLRSGDIRLEEGEGFLYDPQLYVFKVEDYTEDVLTRASSTEKYEYANKRRVKGVMFQRYYLIARTIGVRTKNQKKSWGVWWNHKADRLEVDWDVTFFNGFLNTPTRDQMCAAGTPVFVEYINDVGNKVEHDERKVTKYFDWTIGGGVTTTGGDITNGSGAEGLSIYYARHSQFRNTFSDHNVDYNNRRHSTCRVFWDPCEGTRPNCEGGTSASTGSGGTTTTSPCQPPCAPGYFCLNGNCIEFGGFWECIPPCPPDEQCINGQCVPL